VAVTYKIDSDKKTVRTDCVGLVTLEEVIGHFQTLEQDSECPDRLDVLLNLTQMESLPETHEISRIVTEIKRVRVQVRFGACAIVANRDAVVGMMRVFEALADECFRVTHTFREVHEAEAWLILQQLSTESNA